MGYQTAEAARQFQRWSRRYDRDPLQWLFFQPSHRALLDQLGADDRWLLDVGCGTGQFAVRALQHLPHMQICGLDLSDAMLRQGRHRFEEVEGSLHLVRGDSAHLPFADDTFDVITCAHSFHHYPRQEQAVAEMHRVLRPGGRLLIVDGDRDRWWGHFLFDVVVVLLEGAVRHVSSRSFRKMFHEAGFMDIRQRRRRGPLPFLLTIGRKPSKALAA
jgi:ubiquinone/menaquinone biosynthesis C-methylase UbiE